MRLCASKLPSIMAQEIMSHYNSYLNLPLTEKILEICRTIDQSPIKDLQALYPQFINNIFGLPFTPGWGLRFITVDSNRYEFECLVGFLAPEGPFFRLIYKLLSDPQLKYTLSLNQLPLDLRLSIQKRCPQFYTDMLCMDPQSPNVVALALNPFDYYIFNFALHLLNNNQSKSCWENWNSVYFTLACDYLIHFLPSNPCIPVLPHIPNYSGKVLMAAPLQTANRPLNSPSLLFIPDVIGMNTQHNSAQVQSRNEIWRSETVLQAFIDIWMSVDQISPMNIDLSSPERVRIVRVLIKHLHSYSAKHINEPLIRSDSLRKYARQMMCTKSYQYVRYLITTWPLDASFRLVMELWLSFIQPWRYVDNTINQERYPNMQIQEEGSNKTLDPSFIQFIAENYPSYTCIFQLVLQRFLRLDLTAYKNAIMLFRLGKVFSQPLLVPILKDLEKATTENITEPYNNLNNNYNYSFDYSNSNNDLNIHKWVTVAKQAITEVNISTNFTYKPIWSDANKPFISEFVSKIAASKLIAEKIVENHNTRLNQQNQDLWTCIKQWLMIIGNEEELSLEECKKVPKYLDNALLNFSDIFGLSENNLMRVNPFVDDDPMEHSSFANSTNFPLSMNQKVRNKATDVRYMGDPELMPITSYESVILVRVLYEIASRLNETYQEQFSRLWYRNDFVGYFVREILQGPCTIQKYVKDATSHQSIAVENLPPRLSLRRLGSYAFIIWLTLICLTFKLLFSHSLFSYLILFFVFWILFVAMKASFKMLKMYKT